MIGSQPPAGKRRIATARVGHHVGARPLATGTPTMTTTTPDRHPRFEHRAVFHEGPDHLADLVHEDVVAALGAGDAVLVSAPEATWAPLATRLGEEASAVRYVPDDVRFTQPTVALKVVHDFVRERVDAGATATMSIGAIPVDGDAIANDDWMRYESSVEEILGHLPLRGICAYDVAVTPPAMLDVARLTHDGDAHRGGEHAHPRAPTLAARSPVPQPTTRPDVHASVASSREGRDALGGLGSLGASELEDLRLVVSELVTNAILHGGAPVWLSVWSDAARGTTIIDVSDGGTGIDDPYFELRPPVNLPGGAGLWIIGQLSQRVTSHVADGTHHVTALVQHVA